MNKLLALWSNNRISLYLINSDIYVYFNNYLYNKKYDKLFNATLGLNLNFKRVSAYISRYVITNDLLINNKNNSGILS